jgi:CRP-like cAMP-binding protein
MTYLDTGNGPFRNGILRRLDGASLERLRLKAVQIEGGQRITGTGDQISKLLFLESGAVQFNILFRDSTQIQVAMAGIHSILGATALLDRTPSLYETTAQGAGHGFFCLIENARQEFARHELFHQLALSCIQMQLMHVAQLSGCNAKHSVEQRLCRWLLLCQDEMPWKELCVTQEALANALGVRRTTVTLAMDELRMAGLVDYSRGHIRVSDRPALELRACECYQVIRSFRFPWDSAERPTSDRQALMTVLASDNGESRSAARNVGRQTERRPRYHIQ